VAKKRNKRPDANERTWVRTFHSPEQRGAPGHFCVTQSLTLFQQRTMAGRTAGNAMDVDDDNPFVQPARVEARTAPVAKTFPDTRPTVGYVWSEEMLAHRNLFDDKEKKEKHDMRDDDEPSDREKYQHPEAPARLQSIYQILEQNGLLARMKHLPIRTVRKDEVMLTHTEDLWEKVMAIEGELPSLCMPFGHLISRSIQR
jgi:hypothetical protein